MRENISPTKEGAQSFLCGMPVKAVAIEACGMWRAAMSIFRELGYCVKLTSPKKTKDIACKKKTDKVDAKTLANLLRTGYIPEVCIPNDETLQLRDIARQKVNLTRMRVEVQSNIKVYFLLRGIKYPKKLWSNTGLEWLTVLNDPNTNNWLRLYHSLLAEEKEVMSRIRKINISSVDALNSLKHGYKIDLKSEKDNFEWSLYVPLEPKQKKMLQALGVVYKN